MQDDSYTLLENKRERIKEAGGRKTILNLSKYTLILSFTGTQYTTPQAPLSINVDPAAAMLVSNGPEMAKVLFIFNAKLPSLI